MPSGVYVRSEETLKKFRNRRWKQDHRNKISESLKRAYKEGRKKAQHGNTQSIVARLKNREKHLGSKNASWKGGISFQKYPTDWTKTLRVAIRERDRYLCKMCGEKQADRVHHVHHIDYNKHNCNPNNLVTLCGNCHRKTNFNREYWIEYFDNNLI